MSPRTRPVDGGSLAHPILPDSIVGNTPAERAKAMLTVAGHAYTVDDCRQILEALGLLP